MSIAQKKTSSTDSLQLINDNGDYCDNKNQWKDQQPAQSNGQFNNKYNSIS